MTQNSKQSQQNKIKKSVSDFHNSYNVKERKRNKLGIWKK